MTVVYYTISLFVQTLIDECATNNGDCNEHSTCMNVVGNYRCICHLGYAGNGKKRCIGKDVGLCLLMSIVFPVVCVNHIKMNIVNAKL